MKRLNGTLIAVCTAVGLIISMGTVFIAYGAQGEKVKQNTENIEELKRGTEKIYEIDKKQAVLNRAVEAQTKALDTFRRETSKAFDRILKKLDE